MNIIIPEEYETPGVKKGREILYRMMQETHEAKEKGLNPIVIQVGKNLVPYIQQFWEAKTESFDGVIPKHMYGLPIQIVEEPREQVRIGCAEPQ